jgi:hypothetical protein
MTDRAQNEPVPPSESQSQPSIDTGGGTVVQGNVEIRRGDFIGRDKVIYIGSIKVPRWLAYAAVALLATVVTAQAAGLWQLSDVAWQLNQPTPTPLPTLAPTPTATPKPQRMTGDFNLVVAQFGALDDQGNPVASPLGQELSLWLARRLDNELRSTEVQANLGQVQVWHEELNRPAANPPLGPIRSEAEAIHLVNTISATMIISGVLTGPPDEPDLRLAFFYASPTLRDLPDAAQGQYLLGSPVTVLFAHDPVLAVEGQDANGELVQRASLLVWLIKALTRETIRQPLNALDLFREAEGKLTGWDNAAAWSVFYYFMGRTALLVQDLPEAQRTLTLAVEKNGENAPAQIALGNFYYTLAQLYFTRQQPLAEPVAACAAEFSDARVDVNTIAANSPLVPADYTGAEAALVDAQTHYGVAQALAADQQAPELFSLARLMQASAHRLAGEGALFAFDQAGAAGGAAFLAQAQTNLNAAEELYRATLEPFTQGRRFGFLAYAWHGLGLTARARAYLQQQQADPEAARQSYATAIDHFAACRAQRVQKDRNGDAELQKKLDCFCAASGAEVEQQYINLGGGEG